MEVRRALVTSHSTSQGVTTYTLLLHDARRSWMVHKRYSDFVRLHAALIKETGLSPPASVPPLPPKVLFGKTSDAVVAERKVGLQAYVQALAELDAGRAAWKQARAWRDFVAEEQQEQQEQQALPSAASSSTITSNSTAVAPPPLPQSTKTAADPAAWIDTYRRVQSSLIALKQLAVSRESYLSRGETLLAVDLMGQGKRAGADIKAQISDLRSQLSLDSGTLSSAELNRRQDLLDNVENELTALQKQLTKIPTSLTGANAFAPSSPGGASASSYGAGGAAMDQARAQLFALPSRSGAAAAAAAGTAAASPQQQHASARPSRVFGSAASRGAGSTSRSALPGAFNGTGSDSTATAAAEVVDLDNRGLLQLQSAQLHQQDAQLDLLANVLRRQKEIGMAMNDELDLHNNMLDEVGEQVDTVGTKLKRAGKRLGKLS